MEIFNIIKHIQLALVSSKDLSDSERSFLYSSTLVDIASIVYSIFVNFYIWQNTNDINLVLFYNLGFFISVPIASLLVGHLAEKKNVLKVYKFGLLLFAVFGLLSVIGFELNTINLFVFGIIFGTFGAFRWVPNNVLFMTVITKENSNKFEGLRRIFVSGINIFIPFISALIIGATGNYNIVFGVGIIIILGSLYLLRNVKTTSNSDGKYELSKVLRIDKNKDKWYLLIGKVFEGIWSGINAVIISILSLYLIGSITNWGLLQIIFSSISIICLLIFTKKAKFNANKYIMISVSLLLFFVSVLFALNLNILWYIIYSLASAVLMSLFWSVHRPIMSAVMSADNLIDKLRVEYSVIHEFPLAVGRIIPILIFLIFGGFMSTSNLVLVALMIVLMGTMPYLESVTLSKTKLFRDKI